MALRLGFMKPAVAAMPPVAAVTQPAEDVPHAGLTTVGVSEGAEHEFWPSTEKEAWVTHAWHVTFDSK